MSDDKVTMTDLEEVRLDWTAQHLASYLDSGGAEGHIVTLAELGGFDLQTTLLLRTIGRKSGEVRIVPLVYGDIGGEVVIVASKAGADVHPAWYLNLVEHDEAEFQIATQAFRGSWREPAGAERDAVWDFIQWIYPPYAHYRVQAQREIPLVMMKPLEAIPVFTG